MGNVFPYFLFFALFKSYFVTVLTLDLSTGVFVNFFLVFLQMKNTHYKIKNCDNKKILTLWRWKLGGVLSRARLHVLSGVQPFKSYTASPLLKSLRPILVLDQVLIKWWTFCVLVFNWQKRFGTAD